MLREQLQSIIFLLPYFFFWNILIVFNTYLYTYIIIYKGTYKNSQNGECWMVGFCMLFIPFLFHLYLKIFFTHICVCMLMHTEAQGICTHTHISVQRSNTTFKWIRLETLPSVPVDINALAMQPDGSSRSHKCTPCSTVVEQ